MELRPYQVEIRDGIYRQWESGDRFVLACLATGGGKTVVLSDIVKNQTVPVCVIAHRQELVSQISLALARNGVYHRIIASTAVVGFCVQLHKQECGKSFFLSSGKIAVAGVQTLLKRQDEVGHWAKSVGLWVQDECFPAGTPITMSDGSHKGIEDIEPGDLVQSWDEHSDQIVPRRVVRLFKNPMKHHMIHLNIGDKVIRCTPNHPIRTNHGWQRADEIRAGDTLYELRNTDFHDKRESAVSTAETGTHLLLSPMRVNVQGQTSSREETYQIRPSELSSMSRCIPIAVPVQESTAKLLLKGLLKRLPLCNFLQDNDADKQALRIRSHEGEQPNEIGEDAQEGQRYVEENKTSTKAERRQRSPRNSSGDNLVRGFKTPRWLQAPSDSVDQKITREPCSLQDRLWERGVKTSNRSRWSESPLTEETGAGQEERFSLNPVRVDSVEIHESADSGEYGLGDFVYNFEVEGTHTYFAESILVHNCHHLLRENQWGKAAAMFPNARGLGVTATPCRADGKGLGADTDGIMDSMVEGVTMRDLIDSGYLTDYKIYAPPNDIHLENVGISKSTGDYVAPQLRKAVAQSHIHGDVVDHYLRLAKGKLGITFATDIEAATEISKRFNAAGVPSEVITGKTPDRTRNEFIRRFRSGQLKQLVNVDIFGEGFDLPTLEVVSMARPTESYSLFAQQFGRALRPMEGKSHAIIIDHVGNTIRHGLPDAPRKWTLDRRSRKDSGPKDEIPTRSCPECTAVYERIHKECPECGYYAEPADRSSPDVVDGDLIELTAETLAKMRGSVNKIKQDPESLRKHMLNKGVKPQVAHSIANNHADRKEAHDKLFNEIAWWGAYQRQKGEPDSKSYRRFYHKFGIDVLSAQTIGGPEANELAEKVKNDYSRLG